MRLFSTSNNLSVVSTSCQDMSGGWRRQNRRGPTFSVRLCFSITFHANDWVQHLQKAFQDRLSLLTIKPAMKCTHRGERSQQIPVQPLRASWNTTHFCEHHDFNDTDPVTNFTIRTLLNIVTHRPGSVIKPSFSHVSLFCFLFHCSAEDLQKLFSVLTCRVCPLSLSHCKKYCCL